MHSELFWVEGPWAGRLAVLPRPRGGDWLADEISAWRRAGVDVVVSLLTQTESADLGLHSEADLSGAHGIQFVSFPISDRGVPTSRRAVGTLVCQLDELLRAGKNVAIHCRQGIGRAPLITACLLVNAGADANTAIQRVIAARGCPVPETAEQSDWVGAFAREQQPSSLKE